MAAGMVGLLAGLGLIWAGCGLATQSGAPAGQGRLQIAGLAAPVEVVRDRNAVPHVLAQSRSEAYLGLGFAHAQDRLWQMELLRMSARGRLSELMWPTTLGAARLARTLAFGAAADAEWTGVSKEVQEHLVAYSDGVNSWLEEVRAGRVGTPLEFRWLGYEPERWRPEDTLAIVRMRAWLVGRSLGASLLLDRLVMGRPADARMFRRADGHDQ